jgi:hypothetical protein
LIHAGLIFRSSRSAGLEWGMGNERERKNSCGECGECGGCLDFFEEDRHNRSMNTHGLGAPGLGRPSQPANDNRSPKGSRPRETFVPWILSIRSTPTGSGVSLGLFYHEGHEEHEEHEGLGKKIPSAFLHALHALHGLESGHRTKLFKPFNPPRRDRPSGSTVRRPRVTPGHAQSK